MKHYLRVNHAGEIIGCATYPGGFLGEHDLADPDNYHPLVVRHRKLEEDNHPDFSHYVAYECDCPSTEKHCLCPFQRKKEVYVNDVGALEEKPDLTILIDGVPAAELLAETPILKAPGATIQVKLQAAAPDGHTVTLQSRGPASLLQSDTELTFTGGETPEVTMYAPAFGITGWANGRSKFVRPFRIVMKGWSV